MNDSMIATPVIHSKCSKDHKPSPSKVVDDRKVKDSCYKCLAGYLEFLQRTKEFAVINPAMDKQLYINSGMRAILVDWMCELCYNYSLHRVTYHLAVILLDRYIAIVHFISYH